MAKKKWVKKVKKENEMMHKIPNGMMMKNSEMKKMMVDKKMMKY